MTRETKIGLLVGLAFIIVIGILLSDHLTSTNEPQQAQLAQAGGNVRSGVTVPGAGTQPQITAVPATPAQAGPQQQVPTKEELTPKQAPVEIVQIGGSGAAPQPHDTPKITQVPQQPPQSPVQIGDGAPTQPQTLSAQQGVVAPPAPRTPVARTPNPGVPGSLANVANTMGEELVPAGGGNGTTPPAKPADQQVAQKASVVLPPGAKQVKAEAGESLSKLASRYMGSASKANCAAIIALNPSLQKNPDVVVSGRTYVMPAASGATAAAAGTPAAPTAPATPTAPAPEKVATVSDKPATPEKPATSSPEYFYTVKSGDTLTKICMEQLGNSGAVVAIKDLNKDVLKGTDTIRPNMKLRLPAKPLASAAGQ